MNHMVSFHAAFDFSGVYGQFGSLLILSFPHKVCGYAIQVFLLYLNLYSTTFLCHLDLVVAEATHSDSDMFCIAWVLYQNCSTQALECSNQNLVLYFAVNNIPCLKTSQIELNILIIFGCFPS